MSPTLSWRSARRAARKACGRRWRRRARGGPRV